MKAFVKDIEIFLPERIVTNEDLCKQNPHWDAAKIMSKVGIKQRHIAKDEESSFVLAFNACNKLLKKSPQYQREIDFVLYSTLNHEHFMMCSSALLQHRLHLSTSCGTLDLRLACSGYIQLISVAKSLVVSGMAKNVLVVTADTYSKRIQREDIGTLSIFGDAATATIVSSEGWGYIGDISLGGDGIGTENHIARIKCLSECYPDKNVLQNDESVTSYSSENFYMVGSEIFTFVTERIPVFYNTFLERNSISINSVDLHIFHQANKYMLNYLKKRLKIPDDRFYLNMSDVGNTSTSSLPICLYRAYKNDNLHGTISLCAFGGGYTWGAAILIV